MKEAIEKAKGRTKEAIGDMTGDKKLQREGKIDRASAGAKEKVGNAVDKVKDKTQEMNDKVHSDRR